MHSYIDDNRNFTTEFGHIYCSGKGFHFNKEESPEGISKILNAKENTDILHYGILIRMALRNFLLPMEKRVGNSPTRAYVYTYTRGKMRYAGEIGSPMSGISYNRVTKRLHASWGGCGNVEYWYYTLTKNKKGKTGNVWRVCKWSEKWKYTI